MIDLTAKPKGGDVWLTMDGIYWRFWYEGTLLCQLSDRLWKSADDALDAPVRTDPRARLHRGPLPPMRLVHRDGHPMLAGNVRVR